jgi:hypothetical protein
MNVKKVQYECLCCNEIYTEKTNLNICKNNHIWCNNCITTYKIALGNINIKMECVHCNPFRELKISNNDIQSISNRNPTRSNNNRVSIYRYNTIYFIINIILYITLFGIINFISVYPVHSFISLYYKNKEINLSESDKYYQFFGYSFILLVIVYTYVLLYLKFIINN